MREISICFRRKTYEASSPSSSISLTRMDSFPDGVVRCILSRLSNAKDVASCNCVSKKWKDFLSCHKKLCFPYGTFDNLTGPQTPDCIVMQMVSSVSQLEDLVVACPFTRAGLASWLLVTGSSLKNLELHVLHDRCPPLPYKTSCDECLTKLECIQAARNLESLRLWGMFMVHTPKWDVFHKLQNLEISQAKLEDSVLREAIRATPNLTRLVLGDCEGLTTIWIDELLELWHCQLDVSCQGGWSLTLKASKIEYLEVKGCSWIRVHDTNCLKSLSICNNFQVVTMVDLGGNLLGVLESLCVEGIGWRWDELTKMLQLATHVKHLCVFIKELAPFPEIDFVGFFKTHPELKSFHVLGGIFDALCNNHTTLENVIRTS